MSYAAHGFRCSSFVIFFFNYTATTEIYTLSLHDALPIYLGPTIYLAHLLMYSSLGAVVGWMTTDRKSTRLNSSHSHISYAVFCLNTKTKEAARPCLHKVQNSIRTAWNAKQVK